MQSPELTPERIRHLTAHDLGLDVPIVGTPAPAPDPLNVPVLHEDHGLLLLVQDLLQTYGGVIFVGPPGTSKSWYAARIGATLADGDATRFRRVQFHPSYQYEDFIQGFVPTEEGFVLTPKHFLEMCQRARDADPAEYVVLVIDELSRGDPGRVSVKPSLTLRSRSETSHFGWHQARSGPFLQTS